MLKKINMHIYFECNKIHNTFAFVAIIDLPIFRY